MTLGFGNNPGPIKLYITMMMIGLNPGPRARTVKPGPRHIYHYNNNNNNRRLVTLAPLSLYHYIII